MAIDLAQSPNEVKTIIKGWMDSRVSKIHTAMPGRVVSYDPSTNRASVQPNGDYKSEDGRNIQYPIIHNVPIHFPMGQGGTAGITFPINAGDGCLLVFSETQTDDFLGGNKGDSEDSRRHSLNDAIAIPGVHAGAAPSNVAHPGDVCVFKGGTMLRISEGSVEITGATLTVSGDVIGGGISLDNHTHMGAHGKTSPPL